MILLDIPEPENCNTCIFCDNEFGYCCLSSTDGELYHAKDVSKYCPEKTKPDWCPASKKLEKVYVITTGEYSDYTIRAVTPSKEQAEKLKRYYSCNHYYGGEEARIEEYDIDKPYEDLDDLVPVYYVRIYRNGKCYCGQSTWAHKKTGKIVGETERSVEDLGYSLYTDPNTLECFKLQFEWYGLAKNEEHALKIAQDKRAKLLEKYYFDRKTSIDQRHIVGKD